MSSIIKVDSVQDQSGNNIINENSNTITIGASGDTVNVVGTLQNNGAAIPGDISSVVAGTGLSGGGTSGAVTLSIADNGVTLAKMASGTDGNLITYDTSGNPAAVATGSAAQVLTSAGAGAVPSFQAATVPDNAITLAKMASGTDGNIISYDASGNPVAIATGSDGQVLTSAGAGAQPAFETLVSAANTPAFLAYVNSSTQTIANNATVKITNYNAESFDTDNAFANSQFTVPSGGAGKYVFHASVSTNESTAVTNKQFNIQIKAGSTSISSNTILRAPYTQFNISAMADLSEGTTISMHMYQDSGSTVNLEGNRRTFFGGFRLT